MRLLWGLAIVLATLPVVPSPQAHVTIRPGAVQLAGVVGNPTPRTIAECEANFQVACYNVEQMRRAYNVAPLYAQGNEGQGQTIAIVDAFGSPTIEHDLEVFDQTFALPAPQLEIIQPVGAVPPFDNSAVRKAWAGETTLDVEWAHAVAPKAKILLVETPVAETEGAGGFPEIVAAEKHVIDHHMTTVISQSFLTGEGTFPDAQALLSLRGAYVDAARNNVTVLAASGDDGATAKTFDETTDFSTPTTTWPASDPLVTGVGGTTLHLDATGARTAPDSVWNDTFDVPTEQFILQTAGPQPLATGGGVSSVFTRPPYQNGVAAVIGSQRGVPDISLSGACSASVDVFNSYDPDNVGWHQACGTSEATPLLAGLVALAAQRAGHPLGLINPALYRMSAAHTKGLVDVTTGDTSVAFLQDGAPHTVTGASASPGYDIASGVGTVDAALFVPELARQCS